VKSWNTGALGVEPHRPEVLCSTAEGRAILVALPAGEMLHEHQVHEHTWLVVASGSVEIRDSAGATVSGMPGLLAHLEPNERHEVRATTDARVVLLLTPWPGEGHPSERARANPELVMSARR